MARPEPYQTLSSRKEKRRGKRNKGAGTSPFRKTHVSVTVKAIFSILQRCKRPRSDTPKAERDPKGGMTAVRVEETILYERMHG